MGDFRRFWEKSYERLDIVLGELKQQQNTKEKRHGRSSRSNKDRKD